MSSYSSALPSPELGEALLKLPDVSKKNLQTLPLSIASAVQERLSLAHAHAVRQAQAGEEVFKVAVALQCDTADKIIPLVASDITNTLHDLLHKQNYISENNPLIEKSSHFVGDDTQCVVALQVQAASLVAAGEINSAVILLCALLDWPEARNDALLGLAICAVRLKRYDAALVLALDYLKCGGQHPRVHCIIGLCRLKRGERKAAQHHLALAARAARRNQLFRDELRAAQRLLIILNFGS